MRIDNRKQNKHSRFKNDMVFKFIKNRSFIMGMVIIIIFIFIGIFASEIAQNDPVAVNVQQRLLPPSKHFFWGTDHLGRCVFSRIVYGTRTSLTNALIILGGILPISIFLGVTAGYVGGKVDNFIMRTIDVILAFPSSLLALAVTGILGPSLKNLIIAMISIWWAKYARIIRAIVLKIKEEDYILAAKATGSSHYKIILKHILPNAMSPIIVLATLEIGRIILRLASFSFLGLGTQPPTPDWGVMLNDSRQYIQTMPALMIWPGLAIMLIILGFNLFGEGLQEVLSSKSESSGRH